MYICLDNTYHGRSNLEAVPDLSAVPRSNPIVSVSLEVFLCVFQNLFPEDVHALAIGAFLPSLFDDFESIQVDQEDLLYFIKAQWLVMQTDMHTRLERFIERAGTIRCEKEHTLVILKDAENSLER